MNTLSFEETRQAMRQILLEESKQISQEDFNAILQNHWIYIQSGGAGGYWETFYIDNLIFGSYRNPTHQEIEGEQAKLNFRNLELVDLTAVKLAYADCAAIICTDKKWDNADLEGTLFIDSVLTNCSFQDADLNAADFSRSDLRNCKFGGANLIKTDFENCDLTGADFRGASIDDTTSFKNAVMTDVKMDT